MSSTRPQSLRTLSAPGADMISSDEKMQHGVNSSRNSTSGEKGSEDGKEKSGVLNVSRLESQLVSNSNMDTEQSMGLNLDSRDGGLKRALSARQLGFIALGGSIGTGLFLGLGQSLASAGPLSILIAYCLMGFVVWSFMVALGEMATLFPVSGGFIHFASRFVDPSLAFCLAWTYWYSWGLTLPTEVSAAAVLISYWDTEQRISPAVWMVLILLAIYLVNFMGARWFGETEFWMSLLKIITIVGLIILSLVLSTGGGPNHKATGFQYWKSPGAMAQLFWQPDDQGNPTGGISGALGRFLAFWNVFVQAAYSFAGTEIIGVSLGEAKNPRKSVPKAIKRIFWRILLFYVLSVLFVGMLVPYNHPRLLRGGSDAAASPFVIAIEQAGIRALPGIINAVLITTVWSAGNASLYASARTLYALALQGQAPAFLKKCTKNGLPIYAVAVTACFGPLCFMSMGSVGAGNAFLYLYSVSSISIILAWAAINLSYLRFHYGMKKQNISRSSLPYIAPLQPYASWFGLCFLLLVVLTSAFTVFIKDHWSATTFVVNYIAIPVTVLLYFGHKFVKGTSVTPLSAIDFDTGRREIEEVCEDEEKKELERLQGGWWLRMMDKVF